MVTPYDSAIFNYYDDNGDNSHVLHMEDTRLYREDLYGLRTLHERGDLVRIVAA